VRRSSAVSPIPQKITKLSQKKNAANGQQNHYRDRRRFLHGSSFVFIATCAAGRETILVS
jgi:hypothetical protein